VSRIKRITNKLYEFAPTVTDKLTAQRFFQQACEAEEEQKSNDALELYHRALSYDGSLAMAWVNVGTIHFHCREFIRAEECYRKALEIDPKYLLACSNLANVLNEQGRLKEAVEYYYGAIAIDPQFQDAHFYYNFMIQTSIQSRTEPCRGARLLFVNTGLIIPWISEISPSLLTLTTARRPSSMLY
jgi:tetratricopeptide (TPR) repeat protein